MAFRTVVIKERAKLETRLGYLIVRGLKETRIHISEIETLLVETTSAALTAGLISELVRNGVNIIFCNEKHLPSSQLIPLNGNFNASKNVLKQLVWREERKAEAWMQLIKAKIEKQRHVLLKHEKSREANMLSVYKDEVMLNDISNREGHSAKVYFNALFGQDFSRREENIFNPALDYGYAMLTSLFAREIVMAGYLTQLGIWHKGEYNFYNLACDVMEPFRPIVDDFCVTYSLFEANGFKERLKRLFEIQIEVNGRWQFFPNAARLFTRAVIGYLNLEDKDFPHIGEYNLNIDEL